MNLAAAGWDLQGTYWIWGARSPCTRWLLCLLVTSPGPGAQSQNKKDKASPPRQSPVGGVRGAGAVRGGLYPPVLPLVRLHAVQALHEAGDALLQAVDGVVLRVVPAEAVPEAAQGFPHQLQVIALPKTPRLRAAQAAASPPSFPQREEASFNKIREFPGTWLGMHPSGVLTPRWAVGAAPFPAGCRKPLLWALWLL